MGKKRTPSEVEPRKEPKQERSKQTYQVILQGASRIIRREGFDKFSTNKVAEESGVSIGSLYQYFPSKEAIIGALTEQLWDVVYDRVKGRLAIHQVKDGAREIITKILAGYYKVDGEELIFRKTMVELVTATKKEKDALKFHRRVGEAVLEYMQAHYGYKPWEVDDETVKFILSHLLLSASMASVDESIEKTNRDIVVEDFVDMWLKVMRIPPEFIGPQSSSSSQS